MSYLGNSPPSQNFVAGADQFSGTGSQTVFTLSRNVNTVFDMFVTVSNVPQDPFTAYTVAGNTLTFDGAPPSGTNNIDVVYRATNVQTFVPSPGVSAQFGLGSAASPSMTFIGDTNTGIYSPAADTIAIGTGGTERLRVDSAGNAGLGVTPNAWGASWKSMSFNTVGAVASTTGVTRLYHNAFNNDSNNLYRTTAAASMYSQDGAHAWFIAPSGTAGNAITFTQAMTLDANGRLLIGTTSARSGFGSYQQMGLTGTTTTMLLENDAANSGGGEFAFAKNRSGAVGGNTIVTNGDALGTISFRGADGATIIPAAYVQAFIDGTPGTNDMPGRLVFSTTADGASTPTERMRIDSSGNFMVGQTTLSATTVGFGVNPAGLVNIAQNNSTSGGTGIQIYSTAASAFRFFVTMDGRVNATNTTILAISDIRLKENIQDLDVGLGAIMALKPRKFDWKEGKGKDIKGDRGWIAQEFEQVFPDMVGTWRDEPPEGEEPYKSVGADLIPVLVKAIQEQQAMIDEMKAEIAALKAQP
jgi:hypothetical protein